MRANWLEGFFNGSKDDVLSQSFAKGLLLRSNGTEIEITSEAEALLDSWGNRWIHKLQAEAAIPPGPYFYQDNALWKVLRLYDDYQGTFVLATKPKDEDGEYGR